MKYAIISDVHSNVFALRAALSEIDKYKPDVILLLGDIVGNGFYPEETVSLVRKRKDIVCVKGNHDIFVCLDLDEFPKEDTRLKMFRWQQKVLSEASKEFLSSLPRSVTYKDGKYEIVAFHYPMNKKGRFKDIIYMPTDNEVRELFSGLKGNVFIFGHEHTGSFTRLGDKYYLNFGTLGNFLEKDCARFGILDVDGDKLAYKAINAYYDDSVPRKKTEELNAILFGENNDKPCRTR